MGTVKKNKTKLIGAYTPRYRTLVEKYFLPSVKDDMDIQLYENETSYHANDIDSERIGNYLFKSQVIIKTIRENPGEIFIYSDVDIEFFARFEKSVLKAINGLDIVCQLDDSKGTLCSGFFGMRSNRLTLALWEELQLAIKQEHCDQPAFNRIIRKMKDIRFGYLPVTFFGRGTFASGIADRKDQIYIPYPPVMFHANNISGVEKKIAMMDKAKAIVNRGKWIVLANNTIFMINKMHRRRIRIAEQIISNVIHKKSFDIDAFSRPRHVCVDVSTICQLNCVTCPTSNKLIHKVFGSGFLSFNNYKHFVEAHPWITRIELSNWGEVFLNPELTEILEFSQQKNILLTIENGANMNKVPDKVLEALVRCKVQSLTCSIDGASEETYSVYRVNGSYNQVIKNIRRLNEFKQQYSSDKPHLKWQFVAFGHNEHEIGAARAMADSLGMKFELKLSWEDMYFSAFSPVVNKELIRAETGLGVADRKEFEEKFQRNYLDHCCLAVFRRPHITFNGKLLGCGINHWTDFGNVFHEGLEQCLMGERYQYTKELIMGLKTERDDLPCAKCKVYYYRKTTNNYSKESQLAEYPL